MRISIERDGHVMGNAQPKMCFQIKRTAGNAGSLKAALVVLLLCGCGSNEWASVAGTVALDGEPLERGTVVFLSAERATGIGTIGTDGEYTVTTGAREGMAPGTYRVTITAFDAPTSTAPGEPSTPPLITPVKYNNAETSGLTAQISAGSNRCDFDMTSDPSS